VFAVVNMSLWTQVKKRGAAAILFALLWFGQALAQSTAPLTNNEVSKETENPVARQITLPLRYQADFLDGAAQLTRSTFEVDQVIVPFRLDDDWSRDTTGRQPRSMAITGHTDLGLFRAAGAPSSYEGALELLCVRVSSMRNHGNYARQ
jgi:hypothetical protein